MLQEIGANIVTFLLGCALTYFTTRWSKMLKKIEKLEFGVQALLRDRMLQILMHYFFQLIQISVFPKSLAGFM